MKCRTLTATLLLAICAGHASGQLVINEIMQSNIDCMMDDRNEFPDSWVELCNTGKTSLSLGEYSLGTSNLPGEAWQLPDETVEPGRYVVIYCDKVADGKHTPFRIESGSGGALYLFRQGEVADRLTELAKQPAPNVAYGRISDGSETWGYQHTPTPGRANCGRLVTELLGDPIFSQPGQVMANRQTVTVSLSLPEGSPAGAIIKMTYDGSEPTILSATYTAPITINKNTTLRAKIFCDGYISPRATTHSYIFHNRAVTLPVISIVTDNKYFFDNKLGIYVDGNYSSSKKNYEHDWRRPVNIEYFDAEQQESAINQLCETRVQGGASRGCQLKSLVVYANKRFGKKRLKHEFFPDQKPGLDKFKSIILRNAGNDFDYLYMRDAIIQRTMAAHTDLDWQAWRPAIVYINGTYKGMLNIRERSTDDYVWANYDGLEDIDMLENWGELKAGDKENWRQFRTFYAEHGHTLDEYAQWIDWKEFINLMLMNLYYNNQDFPGNNIVMWRERNEAGRWRFVAKDTDFGLGLYGSSANYNSIKWIYDPNYDSNRAWANQYDHTRLFRRMMEDTDFKREFIDRAAIYMGDFMNERGTRAVWDPMYEEIKAEYPHHRQLINQWWPNYNSELTQARQWIANRTNYFYQHLKDYYQLGAPVPLTVNQNLDENARKSVAIYFNGVRLSDSQFDGKFFANRQVTLRGEPVDGQTVTSWTVLTVTNSSTQSKTVAGPEYTFAMPSNSQRIVVNANLGVDVGIGELTERTWTWERNTQGVTLHGVPFGESVSVYDASGMQITKTSSTGTDMAIPLPRHGMYVISTCQKQVKVMH